MKRLAIFLLALPMAANAGLIEIDATAADIPDFNFIVEDFTLIYDDTSGDGLFQFEELVSFSGTSFVLESDSDFFQIASGLLGVGNIDGIATVSGDAPDDGPIWWFANGGGTLFDLEIGERFGAGSGIWNYSVTAVPEPSTLALLGIGLAGIGLARRRKQA